MSVPRMMPGHRGGAFKIFSPAAENHQIFYMKRDISNLTNVDSQNIFDKSFIEHWTTYIGAVLINSGRNSTIEFCCGDKISASNILLFSSKSAIFENVY